MAGLMAGAFDASHEVQLVGGLRQADQRLSHPPRGPCHHQSRTIAHASPPAFGPSLAGSRRREKPGVAGRGETA